MIKALRIAGLKFKVMEKDLRNYDGMMDGNVREIYIDKNCHKDKKYEIMLHEAIHAIIGHLGIDEVLTENAEETVVRCLQSGIVRFILENKAFSRALVKEVLSRK